MRPVTRARLAAGIAGGAGIALLALAQWGPALAALSVAAAALLLVSEQGEPEGLAEASARGTASGLSQLARELGARGRGVVLPGVDREPTRVLVPVEDVSPAELGRIDASLILQRDRGAALGLALPAPGSGLEAAWGRVDGLPEGRGVEEAASHVRRAFAHFDLGDDILVARSPGRIRVAYAPRAFAEACRRAREEDAPWHVQGGCPACSFAGILVARALARPIVVKDAGAAGARVFVDFEVPE